jgi:toxin secretion/phage lysis holin
LSRKALFFIQQPKSIAKKVHIIVIVAVAHLVDISLGDANLFRDAAIFFYLTNELLSILENSRSVGIPNPPRISKAVEILNQKGGEQNQRN